MGISAWALGAFVACGSDGDSAQRVADERISDIPMEIGNPSRSSGAGSSGRQTIRVGRKGGQTGMAGSAGSAGSCRPVPEPRPFSADDVRALIEGTHTTTLAYRAERRSPGSSFHDAVGLSMTVRVELQGEPRIDPEVLERCNRRIEQDVEVTLSFDEPALDVVLESTASAFSSTFAVTQVELGSDVSAALGLPPRDVTTFSLAFNESGMKGTFEQLDECGRTVFPASARCPDWSLIEVALDRQRPGLRPRVLSALQELSDVPLEWSDGSQTTLAVSLTEAPEWACSGDWVETFCPERLEIPVSIRAVTADGRLDAELPAELSLEVATEASATEATCGFARTAGELEGFQIIASYFGVAAGEPGPVIIPPLKADTGFSLHVWSAPESPDRTAAEIQMFALEQRDPGLTPPLDATADPAGARCVVFAASAGSR